MKQASKGSAEPPLKTTDDTLPGMGRALVVVADDDELRALARAALEGDGYVVDEAAGGREALAFLRILPPRVVVMELPGPDSPGAAILEAMQHDEKLSRIPVIVLSDEPAQGSLGGVLVLPRPTRRERLVAVLRARVSRLTSAAA